MKTDPSDLNQEEVCLPTETKSKTKWFIIVLSILFYVLFTQFAHLEGLTLEGQKAIALAVVVVLYLLFDVLPMPVTAILAVVMIPVLGIMEQKEAFASFAIGAMFFVFGVFILAVGFSTTGIGIRISEWVSSRAGTSTKRVVLTYMFVVGAVSSVLADIPTAVIFGVLANELLLLNNCSPLCSNFGRSLMIGIPVAATVGGFATPAGGALNIMTISIVQNLTGVRISFLEWTLIGVPVAIILLLVSWFLLVRLFPAEIDEVKPVEKKQNPLSAKEKKYLAIFLVMMVFWMTESLHGIPLWTTAVVGSALMFLPGIDILTWKDVQTSPEMNHEVPILIGGTNVVAVALAQTQGASWLANGIFGSVGTGLMAILIVVGVLSIFGHYLIPSSTALVAVFVPIVCVFAMESGLSPVVLGIVVCLGGHLTFLLPQSDPVSLATYSHGWWEMRDMVKTGWVVSLIWLAVLVVTGVILGGIY